MKATLRNDDDKGRGHAFLIVHFDDNDLKPHENEVMELFHLSVQGHPSGTYLQGPQSEAKWLENAEVFLPVEPISWTGTELTLEIGPYFTSAFQEKIHTFHLKGRYEDYPKLRAETYKVWKPPRDMANIDLPDPKAKFASKTVEDATVMNRPLKVEEAPAPPPLPEPEASPTLTIEKEPQTPPPEPAPEPPAERPAAPLVPRRPSGSPLVLIIVLGLLLLLLAFGVWYLLLFKRDEPQTPPEATKTESLKPEPKLSDSPADSKPSSSADSKEDPLKVSPLNEARRLLRENASTEELTKAAAALEGQAGAEDALFLIARKLAQTSLEGRMRYAAFFDPLDNRPSGSVAKNAKAAFDEYEAARLKGSDQAAARQEALLDWAETHESSGDAGARELLEMLDKNFKK
ncbi:MAG: hypothetical protein LBT38_06170 [Deltaproteobacteria bacterium]|jgi:hypothetical protein|nr:hypothetical protein [Deltaproteobacteria bacterium]